MSETPFAEQADVTSRPRVQTFGRRIPKSSEVLAQALVRDMVARNLAPGQLLLQEAAMMDKYGVGRSTVREALRILEVNGLVTLRPGPNGGPRVRRASPADFGRMASLFLQAERTRLSEVLDARRFLEPASVRDAARRQDPQFLRQVESLQARGRALDVTDNERYRALMREFHEVMMSGSSNRIFTLVGLGLMSMFWGRVDGELQPAGQRRDVVEEHDRVLTAVLAGREDEAEKYMAEHMDRFIAGIARRQPDAYHDLVVWE